MPLSCATVVLPFFGYQDAYSFELADVYLRADTEIELDDRHCEVVELLGIEVG